MKKILSLFALLGSTSVALAQANGDILEQFTEIYPAPANAKIVSVDHVGPVDVGAYILPEKSNSQVPEQQCGTMNVFELNFLMGNPYRWNKQVKGNLFPFDIIKTVNNNTIVVGTFIDSISVDNYYVESRDFINSSFVLSINPFGQVNWLTVLQDTIFNTIASSVEELPNGNIIVVGLTNDVESSIWKINPSNGDVMLTKQFTQVRTFSCVIERDNKLFVSGTADGFSTIDTFSVEDPYQTGYVNFLAEMDTNFNVTALHCRSYFTFDFSSHLIKNTNSQNILWAYFDVDSFNTLLQTFEVINPQGQFVYDYSRKTNFVQGEFDNKLVVPNEETGMFYFVNKQANKDIYLFELGNALKDSFLLIKNSDATIYDASWDYLQGFTLVGTFKSDSLRTMNFTLPNIHVDSFYTENFIGHYFQLLSGLENNKSIPVTVYPNPSAGNLYLKIEEEVEEAIVYDLTGREYARYTKQKNLDVKSYPSGMYYIKILSDKKLYSAKFIKM